MFQTKKLHYLLITFSILLQAKLPAQESIEGNMPCKDSPGFYAIIESITIHGNQKTKETIILRELTFKTGDCFDSTSLGEEIEKSKINLLKLPLFNFVTIDFIQFNESKIGINIFVEERWFVWPQLAIINNQRNFNTWFQEKDFTKLDYRVAVKQYNVLGLNHIARIGLSYGFTREILLGYHNIAIDNKQKHLIGFSASFYKHKSYFYQTIQNKQVSISDEDFDQLSGKYFRFDYSYRPGISIQHRFVVNYQQIIVSDSLQKSNSNFLAGNGTQNSFIELQYHFTLDKRDSRSYPISGYWFNASLIKTGLSPTASTPIDYLNAQLTFKNYYRISNSLFGANSLTIKKAFFNPEPYFYNKKLGYYDFLRGFEYYVIEADDYYLMKNNVKFELLPKKIAFLEFIPIKKFKKIHYAIYLNTFFDIAYATEKEPVETLQNNLSNTWLYSGGFGIDFVTYYDKVIRIEYSLNSIKEKGIFIHFIAPI